MLPLSRPMRALAPLQLQASLTAGFNLSDAGAGQNRLDKATLFGSGGGSGGYCYAYTNPLFLPGKIYFEAKLLVAGGGVGIGNDSFGAGISSGSVFNGIVGGSTTAWGYITNNTPAGYSVNSNSLNSIGVPHTPIAGDVIGVAFDPGAEKLWFAYNNSWFGSPSAGTDPVFSGISSSPINLGVTMNDGAGAIQLTVKSSVLAYTPPTGFSPLA